MNSKKSIMCEEKMLETWFPYNHQWWAWIFMYHSWWDHEWLPTIWITSQFSIFKYASKVILQPIITIENIYLLKTSDIKKVMVHKAREVFFLLSKIISTKYDGAIGFGWWIKKMFFIHDLYLTEHICWLMIHSI